MTAPSPSDRDPKNDPRTVIELVNAALTEADDEAWNAVGALHWRGSREVLDAACRLCRSDCPQERALGADVLGQLGVERRTFPEESIAALRRLVERESDPDVLESALIALWHQSAPQAVPTVLRLAPHPEARIRKAVVLALTGHDDPRALAQLIRFTNDPSSSVRDWATFGLGTQLEIDTPEIREALAGRLDDPDDDTRGEALVGLARRGDQRVVPALVKELTSGSVGYLAVEAAELIQAPELREPLVALQAWWDVNPALLQDAVAACTPT